MSVEGLAVYGAAAVRWVGRDGHTGSQQAPGGSLASNYDRLGAAPLAAALGSLREVELVDGPLRLWATVREGTGWLRLEHDGAVLIEESLALPASGALGSDAFRQQFGLRRAYVAGAMAGGIASVDMVLAMQRAGLLGFFGAGGLGLATVERAIARLASEATGSNWGANLLHNPHQPEVEDGTVALYLQHGVPAVSASAYVKLTPAILRYRFAGIAEQGGRIVAPNQVFAKVSRREVARAFLAPPEASLLRAVVEAGHLTPDQARLAEQLTVATAVTAEADSGGHTDHRPLTVLLPELLDLRDALAAEHPEAARVFVGAAGGLGTPRALRAAFALGADYVLTGSINQSSVEADTSPMVKAMLAEAASTDVASGPAPDMFELGAKVQVLSRGSMYAARAQRLYELYRSYPSLDALPETERRRVEQRIIGRPLDDVWGDTQSYWRERDPSQLERAEREPRHRMALVFRWYLGHTSRWARLGESGRQRDFQVWCGPAMGAFNQWAAGTPFAELEQRGVVAMADALMDAAEAL